MRLPAGMLRTVASRHKPDCPRGGTTAPRWARLGRTEKGGQIALVANYLAATTTELTEPLGIEVAFRDPSVGQWGLENIVAPVGGEFLEIVAPVQPGT